MGHREGLVGRFAGVGRDVGLPFAVDVADGVDVGAEVDVGRAVEDAVGSAVGVVAAGSRGRWVDATPTTDSWAGPLVVVPVGAGLGC